MKRARLFHALILSGLFIPARLILAVPPPTDYGDLITDRSPPEDYPTFGVQLSGPTGWMRVAEGGINRVARWVKYDDQGRGAQSLFVEYLPIVGTLEQQAVALSRQGATAFRAVKVDGEQGIWAKGAIHHGAIVIPQVFIIDHGNYRYIASLFHSSISTPAEDDALMAQFMNDWKFQDLEEPSANPRFLRHAQVALNGALLINFPVSARPDAVDDPRTQMQLAMVNLKTQDDEFRLRLTLRTDARPDLDALASNLKFLLNLRDDLHWTSAGPNAHLTQWVKTGHGDKSAWSAFGVANIDPTHTVTITFTLDRDEYVVQQTYLDIARKVLQSLQPGPTLARN